MVLISETCACDCNDEYSVVEEIEQSSLVAKLLIINKTPIKEPIGERQVESFQKIKQDSTIGPNYSVIRKYQYTAVVMVDYLSNLTADTILVSSYLGGGDCGFLFEIGQTYLTYGSKQESGENHYWTDVCWRTKTFNKTEEEEIRDAVNGKK